MQGTNEMTKTETNRFPFRMQSCVMIFLSACSLLVMACSSGGGSQSVADQDEDRRIDFEPIEIDIDRGDEVEETDDDLPDVDLDQDGDEESEGILPDIDYDVWDEREEQDAPDWDLIDVPDIDDCQCNSNDECSNGQYCDSCKCYDYPADGDEPEDEEEDGIGCENDDEACLLCGVGSSFCEKNNDCPARMYCDIGIDYGCCRPGPCYDDGQDYCDEQYPDDDFCCLDLNGQCGNCPTGDEEIIFHCLTSQDCLDQFGGGPWWCDGDTLECVPSECSDSSDCPNGPCLLGVCYDNSEIETNDRGAIRGKAYYVEQTWAGRGDVIFELRDAYEIENAELVLQDEFPTESDETDYTLEYYFSDLPEGVYYVKVYSNGLEGEYAFNPISVDYSSSETTVYTDIDFYVGATPPYSPTLKGELHVAPELADAQIELDASFGKPFPDQSVDDSEFDIIAIDLGEYNEETGTIPFEQDELDPGRYYLRASYFEEQRRISDYLSSPVTLDQENSTVDGIVLYVGIEEETLGSIQGTVVTAPEFDLYGVEVFFYNSPSYEEVLASVWAEQTASGDTPMFAFEVVNLESGTYYPRAYVNRYQRFERTAQTIGEPQPLVIDLDQGTSQLTGVQMFSMVPLDGYGSIRGTFTYEYTQFRNDPYTIEVASDASFTQMVTVEEPLQVSSSPKQVSYFIPRLASGDYYLRFSVDHDGSYCGLYTRTVPVTIDATNATEKDVVLPRVALQEDFCDSL